MSTSASMSVPRKVCRASSSTLRSVTRVNPSRRTLSTSSTSLASVSSQPVHSTSTPPTDSSSSFQSITPANEHNNTRTYTSRKSFLFSHYAHLLRSSSAILVFQHNNLSSKDLTNVRKALGGVSVPKALLSGGDGIGQGKEEEDKHKAGFVIARTGVLAAVVQEQEKLARIAGARARARARSSGTGSTSTSSTSSSPNSILPLLSGPIALLTLPTLSPTYIRSLLTALNKSFTFRPPSSSAYPTIQSTSKSVPVPSQLILLGALLESASSPDGNGGDGKLFSTAELVHLSEHGSELKDLHAQLVGLLGSGGTGLVGVLGQAAGGGLVRTLMGLEEGLKGKEGAGGEAVEEKK